MNSDIVFVTALHGNETLPSLALTSHEVPQIIGNPKAVQQQVRFLEKDLNASFATDGSSYEERRARHLLRKIPQEARVVDFHTTTGTTPPFAIVVDLDQVSFAHSLGFTKIVYMKHNIKGGHALINHRRGVSVELGQHTDPKVFEYSLQVVKRAQNPSTFAKPYRLFEVYDIISTEGEYENFRLFTQGQESFYPVLSGENSYSFFGLKAKLREHTQGAL